MFFFPPFVFRLVFATLSFYWFAPLFLSFSLYAFLVFCLSVFDDARLAGSLPFLPFSLVAPFVTVRGIVFSEEGSEAVIRSVSVARVLRPSPSNRSPPEYILTLLAPHGMTGGGGWLPRFSRLSQRPKKTPIFGGRAGTVDLFSSLLLLFLKEGVYLDDCHPCGGRIRKLKSKNATGFSLNFFVLLVSADCRGRCVAPGAFRRSCNLSNHAALAIADGILKLTEFQVENRAYRSGLILSADPFLFASNRLNSASTRS